MVTPGPSPVAMPDTVGLDFFTADSTLRRVLERWLDPCDLPWAMRQCAALGPLASTELEELVATADRHRPVLHPMDKRGQRVDRIEFHPAWDRICEIAYGRFGLAALSHRPGVCGLDRPAPEVAKQALFFLFAHADTSVSTGVSMTDVLARVLRLHAPDLAEEYLPRLTATDGTGWQAAMFLTERAGGSDVGANQVTARQEGGTWRLDGHKWFCSNCQADVFLTLARPEGGREGTAGLGLFLVRRELDGGQRNAFVIHRLKDKLGTRALASGEISYEGALARQVGPVDAGFRIMTEMLNQTRVANAVVSAALVRRSWLEAITHARGRFAFGRRLTDQPLMRLVLSELCLESEACTRLAFLAAAALQRADAGEDGAPGLLRCLTPMVKYHTARRAQWAAHEAMEVRGGNGYIEDWPNARLVRDAHLLSIWEGAGNIMLLDAYRAARDPDALAAMLAELDALAITPANPLLEPLREFLELAVADITCEWRRLGEVDTDFAQFALPGLVERTLHLFAAGLLAADADGDLGRGDGRLALVAALYATSRLLPATARPVTDGDPAVVVHFEPLVDHRSIDPHRVLGVVSGLPESLARH